MKQRTDLSADPQSDVVVFELSSGHIVRICDWPDEADCAHVEIWEHEADMDDNPQVYAQVRQNDISIIKHRG